MKIHQTVWMAFIAIAFLPLALNANLDSSKSAFSVMRSDAQGINLRFDLPAWKLESSGRGDSGSQKLSIDGVPYLFIGDEETLPIFSTCVAIPYSGGVSLSALNAASNSVSVQNLDFDPLLKVEKQSGRHTEPLYPASNIKLSEPMIFRDFRIVTLNIYPFQYDPDSRHLQVSQSMDIRLDFNELPSANEMQPPACYSSVFDAMYRDLIINYDSATDRNLSFTNPRMLVIHGNYSETVFLAKVAEYASWKRQKGFIVDVVSTGTTGTSNSAIKNYIQAQYDNSNTRPDYIVLIGDVTGNMPIPSYSSYVDYYYTWLAGNDSLGDAIIGRISVETTDQMVNYMGKIASFEKNLNLNSASFLNRMVLSAETYQSGISTIYTSRYIKDTSQRLNPQYTYTEEYGSPIAANINTAINLGVALYNFRGWIGMSNWPGTMSSMINAYRLFHALFLTCGTGNFYNSTSTTESVVRYGTATTMGGAITAIGMASASTTTPQNNCLNMGIIHSIYNLGYRDMGSALLYGKLYLYTIYSGNNPDYAHATAGYANLIGDPSASYYVGIPNYFNISAPATIPAGQPHLEVNLTDADNIPVYGASVTLTDDADTQITGFSDENGYVVLRLPATLSGSYNLSASKHDFKTTVTSLEVSGSGGLVYHSSIIDDDDQGASTGNSDGIINGGETIEMYVLLKNTTSIQHRPIALVQMNDPYLSLIGNPSLSYFRINAGETGQNDVPIVFSVAANCPDNYQTGFHLNVSSGLIDFTVYVPLTIRNAKLEIMSHTFVGGSGNSISPGNQLPMTITLKNSGVMNLSGATAILRSRDMFFGVPDSLATYGAINAGQTAVNNSDTFTVFARASCITGMVIPLSLIVSGSSGFSQTLDFEITIGQPALNQPLGQDAYGYFIFDDGDTGYPQCPSYQWIGLAPAEGGSGTALSLTDPGVSGDEGDQVGANSIQTVNLPFNFKFYGINYSRASISANGFISFGDTQNSDWRNWKIPDAGGPGQMIAAFWDDLEFTTGSGVYTWFDAVQHYYVIEWYNLRSGYNRTSEETFQAILYDPLYYPTHSGDGQIKLQYKVINNVDLGASGGNRAHGLYASVGIEDHTGTVGLEYTFNNQYPSTCKPLQHQMALFITTRPILSDVAYLQIESVNVIDTNGNGILEPGETAGLAPNLINFGLQDANNVTAILSSSDPYVTINTSQVSYNNIPAQMTALPLSNFNVSIASNCPSGRAIPFSLAINSTNGNWNRPFTLNVYAAEFSLENQTINDNSGNHNGVLDPGETATLSIRLCNNGRVAAAAGTATLSCSSAGITINNGNSSFASIAAGAYATLSFNLSTSSSINAGTLIYLNFGVTSGYVGYNETRELEIGAPFEVVIGQGTSSQSYPLDRYYNYSVHESIYLASEIAMPGTIKSIAFYKNSGNNLEPISPVSIYIKETTANTLSTGSYSTAGYTLVYSGSFVNNATSGWMEVNLNPMFIYSGASNLSILIVKDNQPWISDYPYFRYTSASNRCRASRSDSSLPTSLSVSSNLPNLRLKLFSQPDALMPPTGLSANPSHRSVALSWNAPVSGTPDSYKIYRNNSLLTSLSSLSFTDLTVTNGLTYTYKVTAIYGGSESDPSESVNATPNAVAPSNLTAVPGNRTISLSWDAAPGRDALLSLKTQHRAIGSYKLFRNGNQIANISQTSFEDTGLTNGQSYTYYVKTVYVNPAGESEASNSVSATPSNIAFAIIGSGTSVNTGGQNAPLNICNNSVHGQMVYTAAELNAAGVIGPVLISGLGFNVISAPNLALSHFTIRIKHTTASIANDWQLATGFQTVYTNPSYMPTAGGWDMLPFDTLFEWNGTDNIVVDIAFGLISQASQTGTMQYTAITNGYRFAWSNTADQSNVFSGGISVARRYNLRFAFQDIPSGPEIGISQDEFGFGEVVVGQSSHIDLVIENTGDTALTGNISTPQGFNAYLQDRANAQSGFARNQLEFELPPGGQQTFTISFSPTLPQIYSGNIIISSNATNEVQLLLPASGTGILNSLPSPVVYIQQNGTNTILSWNDIPFATSYVILHASTPDGEFSELDSTSQTQYPLNTGSSRGFYQVKAMRR